jgi:hypothetical protein
LNFPEQTFYGAPISQNLREFHRTQKGLHVCVRAEHNTTMCNSKKQPTTQQSRVVLLALCGLAHFKNDYNSLFDSHVA